MKVCIVTNLNGIGLSRDFEIISAVLTELGHEVTGVQFDAPLLEAKYDLAIYLEVIPRNLLDLAPIRWAFLNPEWMTPEILKTAQRHMDKVFAKTREGQRILEPLFPELVFYTGFACRDQYDPTIPRIECFLHIGGNSSIRGTQAVLDAWRWKKNGNGIGASIVIVSKALKDRPDGIPNVHIFESVTEDQLKTLQNRCLFHIYPTGTEGYGHALHESESVGAIILTTNAPPMNEMEGVMLLPAEPNKKKIHLADVYEVSALDIYEAVEKVQRALIWDDAAQCWHAPTGVPIQTRTNWHELFLERNAAFKKNFAEHIEALDGGKKPATAPAYIKKKGSGLQVAFIGNFKPDHSTENQIRWALEEGLGHDVELLQENEVNLTAIQSAARFSDILFWVRTTGWLRVPDKEMLEFLGQVKIPTVSIHLDKFWGIPDREALIGVHPFWRTKFVFTADGSRQEDFAARGVNHFWMRPAVSEVFCHPGQPWDMYRCDVGFVGARDYHREYPFRGQMVDFLEKTYGARFKHFTGIRGHALNDVYASIRVTVGDCFQAGTPRYWSDRLPETCGRHGFLLHPKVEGLDWHPVATYKPQDLEDLQRKIEYWLAHENERRGLRYYAADDTMKHDTWTIRIADILRTVL